MHPDLYCTRSVGGSTSSDRNHAGGLSSFGDCLNVRRALLPKSHSPSRSKPPWIRAFLSEAKHSDMMTSILKKGQKRNKKANSSEEIIRLALIILWAIVVVVLGLHGGLALSHHH